MSLTSPPLRRLIFVITAAATVAGCGRDAAPPADHALSFDEVPLPADLREPISRARAEVRRPAGEAPAAADLARYFDLLARINQFDNRSVAGDELYALWRAAPAHFLWIELAARFNVLLRRTADRNAMYALPALADSQSAVGAFVLGRRFYGYGDRGGHYERAARRMAELDSLQQAWLALKLAMVESDGGLHLEAASRLLALAPIARSVGGPGLETLVWSHIAECLRRADRLDGALHAAALAALLGERAGIAYAALDARITLAGILADRRETNGALALYERCASEAARDGHPFLLARSHEGAADVWAALGDQARALDLHLRNASHLIAARDSMNVPRAMISASDCFRHLGRLDSCLAYQKRAETWVARFPNLRNRAGLPARLATYYCQIGQYATADSLLAAASSLAPGAGTSHEEAEIQIKLLREALELGQPALATRAMRRLTELRPNLRDQEQVAKFEIAGADFLARQGEFHAARAALDRAWPAVVARGDEGQMWEHHRAAGELAALRDDHAAARAEFAACLQLAEKAGEPDRVSISRFRLGQALLKESRFAEARRLFAGEADTSFGGRFRTRLSSRLLLGIAWAREGHPTDALRELRRARSLCTPHSPGDLLVRLHIETARCLAADGSPAESERELLAGLELLRRGEAASRLPELRAFTDTAWRDAAETLVGLYLDHPDLLGRRDLALTTLALADEARLGTRADVTRQSAAEFSRGPCLSFFVGRERSFGWIGGEIDTGGLALRELPRPDELQRLAAQVVADMERPGRPIDSTAARELGRLLLSGLDARWPAGATLTLVPDGILGAVPWAALPLRAAAGGPNAPNAPNAPVAVDEVAVSRGPIVEAVSLLRADDVGGDAPRTAGHAVEPAAARPLLAIGRDGASRTAGAAELPALREAEAEAREIAALWPAGDATLRVGDDAAWPRLARDALASYRVIHIATHAIVNEGWPSQATLQLGGGQGGGELPLTPAEVGGLRLDADLVYLSCCEGARRVAGGGVSGFGRAFLDAGARAVLASTVRIDDEAARQMARRFYEHWLAGGSPATALRAAQLELREAGSRWEHPYYWAFYRLIQRGD